jgi:regulator of sigma E protease
MTIIISIAAISFLVLIHELGHFLVARLLGVAVTDFSLGFGPKLITREYGGTAYSLSLFPLGGYVKMLEEEFEGEGPPGKPLAKVTPLARIAISLAGPGTNLLFTLLAYAVITTTGVPHQSTLIGTVFPDTPAAAAGLHPGDRVLSVNGKSTSYWEDMLNGFAATKGVQTFIVFSRNGAEEMTWIAPIQSNGRWIIGVRAAGEVKKEHFPLVQALPNTLAMTAVDVKLAADSFTHLFGSLGQLGGPIMIAQVGAERSKMGIAAMLMFMAFLSANLFVLNLLPLPVLDGGAVVFNLYEIAIGRPLPEKVQGAIMNIGAAIVLALVAAIVIGDVVRIFR